jgi:hypothetical protein
VNSTAYSQNANIVTHCSRARGSFANGAVGGAERYEVGEADLADRAGDASGSSLACARCGIVPIEAQQKKSEQNSSADASVHHAAHAMHNVKRPRAFEGGHSHCRLARCCVRKHLVLRTCMSF